MTQATVTTRAPLSTVTAVDTAIDTVSGVSWAVMPLFLPRPHEADHYGRGAYGQGLEKWPERCSRDSL